MSYKREDRETYLIGKRFGRLTVISFGEWYIRKNGIHKEVKWLCQCDCGNIKCIIGSSLKGGTSKSCGCLSKEISSKNGQLFATKDATLKALLGTYKRRAKDKEIEFSLTEEDFIKLTKNNCAYCGIEPKQIIKTVAKVSAIGEDYIYNGIDRLDNTLGYNINNCVSCCINCNRAKHKLTLKEFQIHVKNMHDYIYRQI